jgi:hypothetical protein
VTLCVKRAWRQTKTVSFKQSYGVNKKQYQTVLLVNELQTRTLESNLRKIQEAGATFQKDMEQKILDLGGILEKERLTKETLRLERGKANNRDS